MITLERLKELFSYNPETGKFVFLPRDLSEFAIPRAAAIFKGKCEGKEAGWRHSAGYVSIRIDGKDYLAHRLAWLWVTGSMPDDEIDHINGNRSDNRAANLRAVDKLTNSHNQSLRATNSTGANGVFFDQRRNAYWAGITHLGRALYLGQYRTIEEATAARRGAEKVLGFSKRHGTRRDGEVYKPTTRAKRSAQN